MTLRCSLSGHDAVAVELENQGFRFSRCRRCHRDLIRSAGSPAADWQAVPAGFRVAWRDTDLSVFRHETMAEWWIGHVRRSAATAHDAVYLASMVSGWLVVDAVRRLRVAMRDRYRNSKRILQTRRLPRSRRQWIVVVSLPRGRGLRLEPYEAPSGDGAMA